MKRKRFTEAQIIGVLKDAAHPNFESAAFIAPMDEAMLGLGVT